MRNTKRKPLFGPLLRQLKQTIRSPAAAQIKSPSRGVPAPSRAPPCALCIGMASVSPPPGSGVWILLGLAVLLPKTPVFEGWISLDFLGFSRPNRDLSMGYTGITAENFSCRSSPCGSGAGTGACDRGHAEGQECHGASVIQFLFSCNKLSSRQIISCRQTLRYRQEMQRGRDNYPRSRPARLDPNVLIISGTPTFDPLSMPPNFCAIERH